MSSVNDRVSEIRCKYIGRGWRPTVPTLTDMNQIELPDRAEMIQAFQSRDASYDGVFITAVRTTGIFCRPTCPARKPLVENILFYATTRDALFAGFTPCKRCRPLELTSSVPCQTMVQIQSWHHVSRLQSGSKTWISSRNDSKRIGCHQRGVRPWL